MDAQSDKPEMEIFGDISSDNAKKELVKNAAISETKLATDQSNFQNGSNGKLASENSVTEETSDAIDPSHHGTAIEGLNHSDSETNESFEGKNKKSGSVVGDKLSQNNNKDASKDFFDENEEPSFDDLLLNGNRDNDKSAGKGGRNEEDAIDEKMSDISDIESEIAEVSNAKVTSGEVSSESLEWVEKENSGDKYLEKSGKSSPDGFSGKKKIATKVKSYRNERKRHSESDEEYRKYKRERSESPREARKISSSRRRRSSVSEGRKSSHARRRSVSRGRKSSRGRRGSISKSRKGSHGRSRVDIVENRKSSRGRRDIISDKGGHGRHRSISRSRKSSRGKRDKIDESRKGGRGYRSYSGGNESRKGSLDRGGSRGSISEYDVRSEAYSSSPFSKISSSGEDDRKEAHKKMRYTNKLDFRRDYNYDHHRSDNRGNNNYHSKKFFIEPLKPLRKNDKDYLKKLTYLFRQTRFFIMKSLYMKNVELAKEKNLWATFAKNQHKINKAFQTSRNVILLFSATDSHKFSGFARVCSEARFDHSPVGWELPEDFRPDSLDGAFHIDWVSKKDLKFGYTEHLRNKWNDNERVKVARDGQEVEPLVAEELCKLFPEDKSIDLMAILKKSKMMADHNHLLEQKQQLVAGSQGPPHEMRPQYYHQGGGPPFHRQSGPGGGYYQQIPPPFQYPPMGNFYGGIPYPPPGYVPPGYAPPGYPPTPGGPPPGFVMPRYYDNNSGAPDAEMNFPAVPPREHHKSERQGSYDRLLMKAMTKSHDDKPKKKKSKRKRSPSSSYSD